MNYTPNHAESQMRSNSSTQERRGEVIRAITLYVNQVRLDDALKRKELAELEGLQRHVTLSKSVIPNSIKRLRLRPRESAGVAILNLITLLCDNNEGICSLTIKRMAQLFGRTERCIRDTIDSLEQDGLLNVERVDGWPSRYWPNVPTVLAQANASVSWFVEALSEKPKRRGRPVTDPALAREENPGTSVPPFSEKTPEREGKNPGTSAHSISLREISKGSEVETPAESPALVVKKCFTADQLRLSDEALDLYNAAAERLGFQKVTDRGFSDARRKRLLRRLADIGGIENFKDALMAIEFDRFLMGKKPPKPGHEPFRLDIEFLLSTESNFGDVLAKLIDGAGEAREKVRKKWRAVIISSFVRGVLPTGVSETLVAELAPGCLRGRDVEEAARLPEEKFVSIPQVCFADDEYDRALAIRREHDRERAKGIKRTADARAMEAEHKARREAEDRDRLALLEGLSPELRSVRDKIASGYRKRNKPLPPEKQLIAEAGAEVERPQRLAELFPRSAQVAKKEVA